MPSEYIDKGIVIMTEKLNEVYNALYKQYGPRHWWPAETPFEVIIGAILTQFVSWKNVETAIKNLKENDILNVNDLCDVEIDTLEQCIKSTRFYKQKANRLKIFCSYIKNEYDGNLDKLFDKDINKLRKELLAINGIGKETADCIILYAAMKPIFVVDAYTKRIFSRLGFVDENISYDKLQHLFMDNIKKDTKMYNEYHALIVKLGNNSCIGTKPKCNECPINYVCEYGRSY